MYMEKCTWPNKYKSAVFISVNLSAELFWIQVNEAAIDMPKTLSMGEYGMLRGLQRVLSVFDSYKIKATFFTPGKIAEKYTESIKNIFSRGHEIASMGYSHENYGLLTIEEQKKYLERAVDAITRSCGVSPKGFRAPMGDLTIETLEIARDLGMFYSSNLSEDDRPFWKELKRNGKIVEIPIHWSLYDLPYFALNYKPVAFPAGQGRIANYTNVLDNWKDEFSGYHDYGLCFALQLDPQIIGTPGRIMMLDDFCKYMTGYSDIWISTGAEIAEYVSNGTYKEGSE